MHVQGALAQELLSNDDQLFQTYFQDGRVSVRVSQIFEKKYRIALNENSHGLILNANMCLLQYFGSPKFSAFSGSSTLLIFELN